MAGPTERHRSSVPPRALALSLGALAVPVIGSFWTPESLEQYAALLWLVALIPAFLLAYYRGWRGVATALAAGMATLSLTQAVAIWLGEALPDLLLGVVVAYVAISLGIGWLAEIFHREVDEVEDLAFTDILTGLPNRRHARVFLENEFAAAERGRALSLVLFDLDAFKDYNDRHGHQAGDEALRAFAEILSRQTRKMDLSARFGGEEFLSILASSDSEGAMIFADRVRSALKDRGLGEKSLTVSGGVASYHPSMRSPDELLAAADHALYRAKRDGRNRVRLFGRTLLEETLEPDAEARELIDPGISDEYPRAAEELGTSQPPVTLLPHQITGFGKGRRALVVEDDDQVRDLVASYLSKEGFSVAEAAEVTDAIRALRSEFDVIVTDLRLPGGDGNDLVSAIKSRWPETQVLVITGVKDSGVAAEALNAGADSYLYKPFGMSELRNQVVDALEERDRRREDQGRRTGRSHADGGADDEAREVVTRGALSLANAVEIRLPHLKGHGRRVARYSKVLLEGLGDGAGGIDPDELRLGCLLHDVGQLQVPREILQKEGSLTPEEYARVQEHPRIGRQVLKPLLDLDTVLEITTWHHERWDGSGYPDRLVGDAIPLSARIAAVADALDAMTTPRPYRDPLSWEAAVEEIRSHAGSQFDPGLVDVVETRESDLRTHFETSSSGSPAD